MQNAIMHKDLEIDEKNDRFAFIVEPFVSPIVSPEPAFIVKKSEGS